MHVTPSNSLSLHGQQDKPYNEGRPHLIPSSQKFQLPYPSLSLSLSFSRALPLPRFCFSRALASPLLLLCFYCTNAPPAPTRPPLTLQHLPLCTPKATSTVAAAQSRRNGRKQPLSSGCSVLGQGCCTCCSSSPNGFLAATTTFHHHHNILHNLTDTSAPPGAAAKSPEDLKRPRNRTALLCPLFLSGFCSGLSSATSPSFPAHLRPQQCSLDLHRHPPSTPKQQVSHRPPKKPPKPLFNPDFPVLRTASVRCCPPPCRHSSGHHRPPMTTSDPLRPPPPIPEPATT